MKQERDVHIEALRGATILLVVVSHAIGIDALGGMQVAESSVWRYIYLTLCANYITMPLFAAIAGWVYALHPLHESTWTFLGKKAKRLLLPMIFTGTLYFVIQHFTVGTNQTTALHDIWQIYILPHSIFWFLPALFLIFGGIALLDKWHLCDRLGSWLLILLLSVTLSVLGHLAATVIPNYFSIWGALTMLPFFLAGVGLQRFRRTLSTPTLRQIYLWGFLGTLALFQILWFTLGSTKILQSYQLTLPTSLLTIAFLLTITRRSAPSFLVFFGKYAYAIYLFHAFGTAAGRIFVGFTAIHSELLTFCCSVILGVGVPLLADKILRHFPLLPLLFLGQTHRAQLQKSNTTRTK
ncbi:MAG: acyltransferase [Alistipes sp.]